jgi:hypothetical protein
LLQLTLKQKLLLEMQNFPTHVLAINYQPLPVEPHSKGDKKKKEKKVKE